MMRSHLLRPVSLLIMFSFVGCSSNSDSPVLVPVTGIVKYNDKPLADADLMFFPKKGSMASGKSDQDGRFTLKTNGKSGAVAGTHQVTVAVKDSAAKPAMLQEDKTPPPKPVIPSKYASQTTTLLKVDIAAGVGEIALKIID